MTLDTRVYVVDEIDLRELFTKCQSLLTPYDDQHREPAQQRSKEYPGSLDNEPMQDLPAWLMVHNGGERPYRTAEQAAEHDKDMCNWDPDAPPCEKTKHDEPCWYEVSYDTAYGYRDANGLGCGDLHARLVAELGAWLDAKGIRWEWRNEFTGEVHEGYDALGKLGAGGLEATNWYRTMVIPAIAARMAGGGS